MAMAASMRNNRGNFAKQKFQRFPNDQKFQQKNKSNGTGGLTISTITCRYCNNKGHFEKVYRNNLILKGKGRGFTLKYIVHHCKMIT